MQNAPPLAFPPAKGLPRDRLAALDLLRLMAAFAVLYFHFGYAGPVRGMMETAFPAINSTAKYGFLGVDLFFLISGFVITASAFGRSWHAFAVSRFIRLYPAHIACMTATALVIALLGNTGTGIAVTFKQWLANLTMVSPAVGQPFMDGAYWSIVIEIVFYGWVGLLVACGLFERRLLTILTVWLAIAFVNEGFFQMRALRFGLATEYAAMFASGILIQRLYAGERSPYAWILLAAAFLLGAFHAFEVQRIFARLYGEPISLSVLWTLYVAIFALFLGALRLSRWLPATPTILTIGGLTYPLYLFHQQAGYVLIDKLTPYSNPWFALFVVTTLMIAFAYAVCRYVEPTGRTFLKWGIASVASRLSKLAPVQAMTAALASPFMPPTATPRQG